MLISTDFVPSWWNSICIESRCSILQGKTQCYWHYSEFLLHQNIPLAVTRNLWFVRAISCNAEPSHMLPANHKKHSNANVPRCGSHRQKTNISTLGSRKQLCFKQNIPNFVHRLVLKFRAQHSSNHELYKFYPMFHFLPVTATLTDMYYNACTQYKKKL